jgi:hypothetical protein
MPDQAVNLTAVFVDSGAPIVSITSPKPNQRITSLTLLATGTSTDNIGVRRVMYSLDGAEWKEAVGTNPWSANLETARGRHLLKVYAEDAVGNRSKTNSISFVVPDYRGIYFGTFSQPFGRGSFGVIVTADQKGLIIAGDTSKEQSGAVVVDGISIGLDGKFDAIIDGDRYFGTCTDTVISGEFITSDGVRGKFSGAKRAAAGIHQASAGYYEGRYETPQDQGPVHGLLAADGTVLGIQSSEFGLGGSAGSGLVNSQNAFTFTTVNAKIVGSLQDNPLRLTGVFQTSVGLGHTSATRRFTTGDVRTAPAVEIAMAPENPSDPSPADSHVEPEPALKVKALRSETPKVIVGKTAANPASIEINVLDENSFGFVFSTEEGRIYRVQSSSDLKIWLDASTPFVATVSEYQFIEHVMFGDRRFYRVVSE